MIAEPHNSTTIIPPSPCMHIAPTDLSITVILTPAYKLTHTFRKKFTSIFVRTLQTNTHAESIFKDQNSFLKSISSVSKRDHKENGNNCDMYAYMHILPTCEISGYYLFIIALCRKIQERFLSISKHDV